MPRISNLLFLSIIAFFPFTVLGSDWSKKEQISTLIDQKMRQDGVPGMSISIIRNGQHWWSKGFGLADIEQGTPAGADTLYRAGSLVKPLTATVLLSLIEQKRVDADKPVWEYCSTYPKKSHPVTVRHLLSHTSGVRTYKMPWSVYEKELFSKKRYESVTDAIRIFADDVLESPPGTRYHYTSYGFNLLGCVVESVENKTFMEVLGRDVLSPARMDNTVVDRAEDIQLNRSNHYRRDRKGRLIHEQYVDMSNKIPSGGLLSTARDMGRFALSYMSGDLLSEKSRRYAQTAFRLNDGSQVNYGAGWELPARENNDPSDEVFHNGLTPGASSIMYLYPLKQNAIVVMSNLYGMDERVKLIKTIAGILDD